MWHPTNKASNDTDALQEWPSLLSSLLTFSPKDGVLPNLLATALDQEAVTWVHPETTCYTLEGRLCATLTVSLSPRPHLTSRNPHISPASHYHCRDSMGQPEHIIPGNTVGSDHQSCLRRMMPRDTGNALANFTVPALPRRRVDAFFQTLWLNL